MADDSSNNESNERPDLDEPVTNALSDVQAVITDQNGNSQGDADDLLSISDSPLGDGIGTEQDDIGDNEDEELPSLSNSPSEGVETERNRNSDNEDLPSLSNSPVGNGIETEQDEIGDMEDDEDLPSIAESPVADEVVTEQGAETASPSVNSLIVDDDGNADTSTNAEAGNSANATMTSRAVRSFKTKVDENGEVVFEFGSDEEEEEEEEIGEQMDIEDFLRGSNSIENMVRETNEGQRVERIRRTREGSTSDSSDIAQADSPESSEDGLTSYISSLNDSEPLPIVNQAEEEPLNVLSAAVFDSDVDEEEDPDYVFVDEPQEQEPAATRAPTTSTRRRKQTRPKKRKGRKKKAKPKPKPKFPTVRKPPKPLVPKIVYEELMDDKPLDRARKEMLNSTKNRIYVNFTDVLPTSYSSPKNIKKEKEVGYKIGEIYLDVASDWTARNRDELVNTFPGLVDFQICMTYWRSQSFIRLITEEKLSLEDSESRPKPKNLKGNDLKRPLIFILNRNHFFPVSFNDLPQKMEVAIKVLSMWCKDFRLDFIGFNEETKKLQFEVQLLQSAILDQHDLTSIPYGKGHQIADILNHFLQVQEPAKPLDDETRKKEDIAWFYGQLKKYHSREILPDPEFSMQPSCVIPVLREYQRNAVRWMLHREGVLGNDVPQPSTSKSIHTNLIEAFLQKMYVQIELEAKTEDSFEMKTAYYNPYVGYVCWTKPTVSNLPTGGVLADEMGLGKTVEIICLILLNQKPLSAEEEALKKLVTVKEEENEADAENGAQDLSMDYQDIENDTSDEEYVAPVKKDRKRLAEKQRPSSKATQSRQSRKRVKTEPSKEKEDPSSNRLSESYEDCEDSPPRVRRTGRRNNKSKQSPPSSKIVKKKSALNSDSEESYSGKVKLSDDDDDSVDEVANPEDSDCEENTNTKKAQKKKPGKRGRPVKVTRSINKRNLKENESSSTPVTLRHPKLRRRRALSPCEFTVNNVEASDVPTPSTSSAAQGSSPRGKRRISNVSIEEEDNSTNKKPRRRKSTADEPKSTYDRVKTLYDAALREFSETNRTRKRFNGTFFDTWIDPKSCFECICGGWNDDNRWVVTCAMCGSSQHADCVGFDRHLKISMGIQGKNYLCPHCAVLEKPCPAKATLIITPPTISYQWINEITKHVRNHRLKILYYKGVGHHGYIPPAKLAEYDIVITNYNVLSAELNYVDLPHSNSDEGRRFRNPKRFLTIPSPLPCVFWWRVCLDEAQMVEGINTKMSMMAMRLQAVHRWCVTGTPINEGLQDLFGLFAFLGVQPVSLDFWWQRLVQHPFYQKDTSLLYELFGRLIWRSGKADVLDQLGIPPQTEIKRWLQFSPVETHFYKQQYEVCSNKILGKIARLRQTSSAILDAKLSTLDRQTLQSLLIPFLELRQACCHPQMVKGQLISLQKGTLTMEELLAQLVKKSSLQCADDHRFVVAAYNGMAGIHMIREEWLEASEKYRAVLQSAEKNKDHFHTDSLQLLHTNVNLADLLDRHHDGIPFTLRDDSLRATGEELSSKYLKKYADGVKAAHDAAIPLNQQTEELFKNFVCERQSWWAATLVKAARLSKIDDLIARIKDDLIDHTKKTSSVITLANKFNDATGLQHVLVENITQMETLRQDVLEGLEKLQGSDPSNFVHAAVCCHLRKKTQLYYKDTEETGFRCELCRYHDGFLKYESILFKEEKKNKIQRTGRKWQQQKLMGVMSSDLTEEERNLALLKEEEELLESLEHVNVGISEELRRGTWGDSDTERVLKIINNFSRMNGLPADVKKDGSTHLKLFEAMKKEFRVLRILWRQIYDQVSAVDELSQATTRLRLKYDNEEEPEQGTSSGRRTQNKRKPKELQSGQVEQEQKVQNIHILARHEVDTKFAQFQLDLDKAKEDLSVHMGQLLYLETLKKNGYGKKGSVNTEDCPVCHNQLGQEWCVLRCGHSYCSECVKKMCPNALHSFLCPLCRHAMKYADVSIVDTRGHEEDVSNGDEMAPISKEIRGSLSTKVEAIVDTLLKLQDTHPGEKALIFSSWPGVLEIIEKALDQNEIKNILLNQTGKKFQTDLDRFKSREDSQALLMPLTSGAKGLNIIEATHVILVEPILNLASELQAIGRVHRIGQTKPTFVHRFYIKKTIEEQLFEILRTHDVTSDDEGSLTVANLQKLIRGGLNM